MNKEVKVLKREDILARAKERLNTATGKEQRYQSPEAQATLVVKSWITAYRTRKLHDEIAAYDFRNIN